MGKDSYRLMITSLYEGDSRDSVEYYYAREGEKNMYCDALLSAEASSKYILANYRIDEIVTLGSKTTFDPGDEIVQMVLREGSTFYSSDIKSMSTYSLLRYRLAQYLDGLRIEEQDMRDLLPEEEQEKVMQAVRNAFRDSTQGNDRAKFSRFFDMLNRDGELRKSVVKHLADAPGSDTKDIESYRRWALNWVYSEMNESSKMTALESNDDVKIRFVPTGDVGSLAFAVSFFEDFLYANDRIGDDTDIELFICIQSEDADDTYALMSLMDLIKAMPGNRIKIKRVVTSARDLGEIASDISDSTDLYGVSELVAGARSFLRSGKTDMLANYWNMHRTDNDYIDRLLNAMRNIDIGISLCDISDIERGISSLRRLFSEEEYAAGPSVVEQYFGFIILAIKEDYGSILAGDRMENIELIKWAYRKGFWQQTLTLIESKAPQDFIDNGIYYYSDGEKSKEYAIKTFGNIFYELKPFEKYKLDDVSHYFVKFYGRGRVRHMPSEEEQVQRYTALRIDDLDTHEKGVLRAHTDCPDENAVGDLLYAYYKVGNVRNATNHAENGGSGAFGGHRDDSDVSERMSMIRQSVEGFIYSYDKVMELIGENGGQKVVEVTNDEIRSYANTLKHREFERYDRKDQDGREDRPDKKEQPDNKEQ